MGKVEEHVPIRTCVVCGAKRNKKVLDRLVVDALNKVVVDRRGSAEGRGAYVCRDESCRERLFKGLRLSRAFRKEISPVRLDLWDVPSASEARRGHIDKGNRGGSEF